MSGTRWGERLAEIELVFFDFDGVFTDNRVWVDQDGRESVACFRSDGLGIKKLRAAGVKMLVVSTETNPVVGVRSKKLQLECVQGVEDKRAVVERIAQEKNVPLARCAFVGNDINDLGAMSVVGVSVAVADAYPEVLKAAHLTLTRAGGEGAVREFCDWVASAKA